MNFASLYAELAKDGSLEEVENFSGQLEEMAALYPMNATQGLALHDVIRVGGCVYIVGSMRNESVIKAQRMLLIRLIQIAERRDRMTELRPVAIFLDELKYHISRPSLEALGAARDKGVHMILAHQALADLRDCPADLDPESVVGAVVENTRLKLAYRVQNPDTAEWLAQMSGTILVDDEVRKVDRNPAFAETIEGERMLRQAERYFFDTNMLLNLPSGCAALFGNGLPQFTFISPIAVKKTHIPVYQSAESDGHYNSLPKSIGSHEALIDVD